MSQQTFRALGESEVSQVQDAQCCAHRHSWSELEDASANQLVFVRRGVFAVQFGAQEFVVDANHVLLFAEGERYRVRHPCDGGDACTLLTMEHDVLDETLSLANLSEGAAAFFTQRRLLLSNRALYLHAQLFARASERCPSSLAIDELSVELLSAIATPAATSGAGAHSMSARARARRRGWARRAQELLATEPAQAWSLRSIAMRVGVAPAHLTTVFRAEIGLSLHRYLRRLRLALALSRLSDRTLSVTEVALASGFATPSHFCEGFRQEFGCAPSHLRRISSWRYFASACGSAAVEPAHRLPRRSRW